MANKVVAIVKKHPKATAAIAVVVIGVVIFATRNKAPAETGAGDASFIYGTGQYTAEQMQAAVAMQQVQAAQTSQANELNAQLGALDRQNEIAKYKADLEHAENTQALQITYDKALLESANKVKELDNAHQIAEMQVNYNYSLADKALDYSNLQANAQIDIMSMQAEFMHQENMRSLDVTENVAGLHYGAFKYELDTKERVYNAGLQTFENVRHMETERDRYAIKKITNAGMWSNIAGSIGGTLSNIYGGGSGGSTMPSNTNTIQAPSELFGSTDPGGILSKIDFANSGLVSFTGFTMVNPPKTTIVTGGGDNG